MKANRRKSESGNALLEFAIGWAVLWFLFSGVYQFGYAFYVYNVLQTACANAAELASKITYDTGTPANYTTPIKNMVVYGDETSTGLKPLVPNLGVNNVNVTVNPAGGFPTDITVTITGYTINAFFTSFALNNKPRATVAFYGQVSCSGSGCP